MAHVELGSAPERPHADASIAQRIVELVDAARDDSTPLSIADAVLGVDPRALVDLLHRQFDRTVPHEVVATGLPASPGAATGRLVVDGAAAVQAAEQGELVVLVKRETTPDDVVGMQVAQGVITARGGLASHAAVVARGWGIPAVVGVENLVVDRDGITVAGLFVPVGSIVSLDGSTGEVMVGEISTTMPEVPPQLATLLGWADQISVDVVTVRANADTAHDVALARQQGARGVGLCRTEHMFLDPDRLPAMRRFILADTPDEECSALAELERVQQHDFDQLLTAAAGTPVTVRLLDPPLHEFLPDFEELLKLEERGELTAVQAAELAGVRRLREVNPMIGTRGVRLAVVRPGLYQMQVRALRGAVAAQLERGANPQVEIMAPLVVASSEMAAVRGWIVAALAETGVEGEVMTAVQIGAMIETPRAALTSGDIAAHADFLSFGTNDLTQLTFGFSRDDVEARLLPAYISQGLLESNPFHDLDDHGVGRLLRLSIDEARHARPGIKIGVCGEHAGTADAIPALVAAGVDYVSCSPHRVMIARLAVAQALLRAGRGSTAHIRTDRSASDPAPTDTSWAAPATAADTDQFLVLHALRIKGLADMATLAEIAGTHAEQVEATLHTLLARGDAKHIESRNLWQLTPRGRGTHGAWVADHVGDRRGEMAPHYHDFLQLNVRLKEVCSAWQVRDGEPNDHTDPAYDRDRIDELGEIARQAAGVIARFVDTMPRFANYQQRLERAAERTAAGETKMFTGVMCGSFHDVWMELHEDLVQILGIDRTAEGSF